MSLQNQNNLLSYSASQKPKRLRNNNNNTKENNTIDFNMIGGLDRHIEELREIIIYPLLHGNVYSHFKIKSPRGILFHGKPGTGKTLVAAALANEINRQGIGKVSFFARKGADILDKWFGGSEKKLQDLFEKAIKCKPSIIFFDELDGLAPIREKQNEQTHISVVTTLLALMDGLDSTDGVYIIGATNRIEAIDPALRRPGRFDKELYFPLPGVQGRRQILQVFTKNWKTKPSSKFLSELVESTSGFSGADLQAFCSEAVLRSMKRLYPSLHGVKKIDPETLKVEECDFRRARSAIVASVQKSGESKMRKLAPFIQPLLDGQMLKIRRSIERYWPHFWDENYKYVIDDELFAGRILLNLNKMPGAYDHIIPALLQQLEYLPSFICDASNIFKKNMIQYPSIVLLSEVDEWWSIITECEQKSIFSALENIHPGLPILLIVTCNRDVPAMLHNFFNIQSCIFLKVENPNDEERLAFLKPLFFDTTIMSLLTVLLNSVSNSMNLRSLNSRKRINAKRKRLSTSPGMNLRSSNKKQKLMKVIKCNSASSLYDIKKEFKSEKKRVKKCDSCSSFNSSKSVIDDGRSSAGFSKVFTTLLNQGNEKSTNEKKTINSLKTFITNKRLYPPNNNNSNYDYDDDETIALINDKNDIPMKQIKCLWNHASLETAENMCISELELLYDVISACINIHCNSFDSLVKNLEDVLNNIEASIMETKH